MIGCAQDALRPADSIDKQMLSKCLTEAGLDPAQVQIPAVGG